MKINLLPGLLGLLLLTPACSTKDQRDGPPAPIVKRGVQAPASGPVTMPITREAPSGVKITAYAPPEPIPHQQQRAGKAVELLIERADRQLQAKEFSGAVSSLERALRIEPRNAQLWHQLAEVRVAQQQLSKAAELAAKSNRYAAGDRVLKYGNWKIIARAKRAEGNKAAAKFAEKKAALYR